MFDHYWAVALGLVLLSLPIGIEDPTVPTHAKVKGGAVMEEDLPAQVIENGRIALILENPATNWTTAFLPGADGRRPYEGSGPALPDSQDLLLFHEYFHGDTGRGLGASHQTGWTALAIRHIEDLAARRG